MQDIRPFVKWAWWKRDLISQFEKYFPEKMEHYVEPFVWWWAVLIYILQTHKIKSAYAFDINPNLINCYQVIKTNVEELIKKLSKYQKDFWKIENMDEKLDYFLKIRDKYNKKRLKKWEINVERAAQFIFLNRTCFNGLYRENRNWEFNVPFWKFKNPRICDEDNLRALSKLIQNVEFTHWNYYDCEKLVTSKSFVYFDPPYRPITKQWFTSYAKENFNDNNQKELSEFYAKLDKKKAKLMLSNSNPRNMDPNDDFFEELYKKFKIKEVYAKRRINSKWDWRWEISELLILNYNGKN